MQNLQIGTARLLSWKTVHYLSSVLMPAALKNEKKFVVVMPLLQDSGTSQG